MHISLINEALKRLEADKGRQWAGAPLAAPRAAAKFRVWPAVQAVLLSAAILALAAVGVCLWKFGGGTPRQANAEPVAAAPLPTPQAAPAAAETATAPREHARAAPPAPGPARAPARPRVAAAEDRAEGHSLTLDRSGPPLAGIPAASTDFYLKSRPADAPSPPWWPPTAPGLAAAPWSAVRPAAGPAQDAPAPARDGPGTAAPTASIEQRPRAPEAETPRFRVTSIAASLKASTAVINGHIVGVGDTVDGARVLSIGPRKVELDVGGRRVTLEL
jgi:hypothetical protein